MRDAWRSPQLAIWRESRAGLSSEAARAAKDAGHLNR